MKKLILILFLACCSCAGPDMFPVTTHWSARETALSENARPAEKKPAMFLDGHEFLVGKDSVIGMVRYYTVRENESLIEIARMFDLGFNEISNANPGTDPFVPPDGMRAKIPAEWILPDVKVRQGIIINIAEMRLYFFPERNSEFVYTFPIGIGDEGTETPVGRFRIIQKIAQPYWRVPKSIKKEDPELPDVVPPGPDNPLGSHAMRLSAPGILIHGTNRPWGIGRKVSHGCIHLYPEDIPWLFDHVKKGTRVTIVEQPVKVGLRGNRIYLEVHDVGKKDYLQEALSILGKKKLIGKIDQERLDRVIREKDGIPAVISR
jgi:L,D-transpeptidase ErfK/SrfK